MGNEPPPNISPLPPRLEVPTPVPVKSNWPKILLFTVLGLVVISVSMLAGAKFGKNKTSEDVTVVVEPTALPTQTAAFPTTTPVETVSILSPVTDPIADWNIYTNQTLGITLRYPTDLFFKEIDPNYGMVLSFEPFLNSETPGNYVDSIRLQSDINGSFAFNILQQAADGKTDIDIHQPCGVMVTKLVNIKIRGYDGIEYIYDGSNPPTDCGRDLIGYEHTILIRKNDGLFIKLVNGSMKPETVRQHDLIFNQIVSTFNFTQ